VSQLWKVHRGGAMFDVNWIIQGSFAIAVVGFMWKIDRDMNVKSETLFRRFDEYKKYIETKLRDEFVSKETCHIMHSHSTNDFIRLEKKVDDGFKNIDIKITSLLERKNERASS